MVRPSISLVACVDADPDAQPAKQGGVDKLVRSSVCVLRETERGVAQGCVDNKGASADYRCGKAALLILMHCRPVHTQR